jgi:hypothetical protein
MGIGDLFKGLRGDERERGDEAREYKYRDEARDIAIARKSLGIDIVTMITTMRSVGIDIVTMITTMRSVGTDIAMRKSLGMDIVTMMTTMRSVGTDIAIVTMMTRTKILHWNKNRRRINKVWGKQMEKELSVLLFKNSGLFIYGVTLPAPL